MRTQAQYTIYALNDVVTQTTAPANPYKGQLWVDTSKSPPVTKVWSGSAWKEANGTDTIRSNVTTVTNRTSALETSVSGLTSTVTATVQQVETLEDDMGETQTRVTDLESTTSELVQTASGLATRVSNTEGSISTLTQNVSGITTRVTNAEGKITTHTTDISGLKTRVTNAEGDISDLETSVSGITTRVSTAEGNISTITQNVSSITSRVSTAEGKITTHTTDINGLKTRVTNAEGDITELEETVDGIETRVGTAEGNISTITQNVSSVTTRVTTAEGRITTHTTDINGLKTRVSTAEGNISTLQQTTSSISATVSNKADKTGGSQSTFGWSLTSSGFYLYSGSSTVLSATSTGVTVNGQINATSGTVGNMTINDKLYFGGNTNYYINANYDDGSYYIYLPGFRVDDGSGAVFSGNLSAPSGTIGGFTISTSSIYKTKTSYSSTTSGVNLGTDGIGLGSATFYVTSAGYLFSKSGSIGGFTITATSIYKTKSSYSSSTAGVYLGTDGIGLGAGSFYVTSAGYLYATNASISGAIYASSGSIANLHITGYLYFGDGTTNYISANYNDGNYFINLPGIKVDNASGAKLTKGIIGSATNNWTIGSNTTDASIYCGISALPSTGGMGTTSNRVYIGTNGLAVKCNSSAESTFNYTTVIRSGMALFYGDANGSSNYNRCVIIASNCIRFCNSKTLRMESVSSITSYQLAAIEMGNSSTYALLSGTWKSSSTIAVVSDRNMKHDIEELDSRYSVFFDALTPKRFKFDDGTSDRFHVGLIAQDVGDALESAGIGLDEFAGLIIDQDPDSDHEWALRYDEILTLCIREIKALKQRISSIEGRTQDEN